MTRQPRVGLPRFNIGSSLALGCFPQRPIRLENTYTANVVVLLDYINPQTVIRFRAFREHTVGTKLSQVNKRPQSIRSNICYHQ
jgi:hypothetical protein